MSCRAETNRRAQAGWRGISTAAALLGLVTLSGTAAADGGQGGNPGDGTVGGGAGGAGHGGAAGASATNFGGGGGGAAGGGAGGTGAGGTAGGAGGIVGSPNGAVGSPGDDGTGGGGGGGGFNGNGSIAAGNGGAGGKGGDRYTTGTGTVSAAGTGGGGGGAGGAGRGFADPQASFTNTGTLQGGGAGGRGGNGGVADVSGSASGEFTVTATGGAGGQGGTGGAALLFSGAGASFTNQGSSSLVTGSKGADGGAGGLGAARAFPGSGAVTVTAIGGVGGAGGTGGAGVVFSGSDAAARNEGRIVGGAGGTGGAAGNSFPGTVGGSGPITLINRIGNGGAGGTGGAGVVLMGGGQIVSTGNIIGGAGGNGGTANIPGIGGKGGDGGTGGDGIRVLAGGSVEISGEIRGGTGGFGGGGNGQITAIGGSGGAGGFGIVAQGASIRLNSTGAIQGGSGGGAGTGGTGGVGGFGVTGGDLEIFNAGFIVGGFARNGTQTDAIRFSAGTNKLTIASTSRISGRVVAFSAADTFALGGDSDGTFDVSTIGAAAQYRGFGIFEKTGAATWRLTGTTTALTPWTITEGTLSIAQDNSLGAASGGLTFDGGTLATTASFATGRGTTLAAGGGAFAPSAGTTLTHNGVISGAGQLTMAGPGTLILTGANSYEGGTRLDAGILQIAAGNNLGDEAGGLTFNGGTLAVTASFDMDRAVTLQADGRFDIAADTRLGLGGTVEGTGDLVKFGAGTLALTGTNFYAGDTLVAAGTLIGSSTSIRGDIGNAAAVVFEQASDAGFSGNITGLDGVEGTMTKAGAGVLTLTGMSMLDWSIEAGGLVTSAARFAGDADIGTHGRLTFDDALATSYGGVLSGAGSFAVTGGGVLTLTGDSSAFAGTTTLEGATMLVGDATGAGKLGGSMTVGVGGRLGGAGTLGSGAGSSVTLASGGTLAPGNSIGTLAIDGDLVFEAGSRFEVEADPEGTQSDLVTVSGDARLDGGSVAHIGADGPYRLRSRYTIISADGALSGRFDGVTSDFAFLTPDLIYDYIAGTVALDLTRNDVDFSDAAHTRNQRATAGAIESIGIAAAHPVYDAIALLPDDADVIRASFDALSGEVHASLKTALIEDSRFVREAANDRLRAAHTAAGDGVALWGQGFGVWGHSDEDGNAARLERSTGGFVVGADTPVFDDWRFGILAGYSRTSFDVDDRRSSGSGDNYHLGAYGGGALGPFELRLGAAYTWHDMTTRRDVAFPGFSDELESEYDAGTAQGFAEIGYGVKMGGVEAEPFASLAYVDLTTEGFTEKGGAAVLHADRQAVDATFTTLGLRASSDLVVGELDVTARGLLGWRHTFGDVTPVSTQAFSLGDDFSVAGAPIARDAAAVEAGVDARLSASTTFGVSYSGQIASDATEHSIRAAVNLGF